MFKGEHHYSLDEKGRIVLPPKFRRDLGTRVVVTRGLDECVAVYSTAGWAKNEKKLNALPVNRRDFARFMLGSAEDMELDKQGRMTIPAHLRQYAKIERDAVVVGMGGRLEIWSEANWQTYITNVQAKAPSLASELSDLSI